MKILIDIGHPAHVHLFKNFAQIMKDKGHEILFTARDKEHEIYLLEQSGFPYRSLGKHYKSKKGKIWGLVKFNLHLLSISLKFKPHIYLSHGSMYAAQVAWLLGKPHISLEDTGNMEQIRLYRPFTEVIIKPDVLKKDLGKKQIQYPGYHELAYLAPKYFTPDPMIYKFLDIPLDQKYCIVRFVSWQASHDRDQKGLSFKNKVNLIQELSKRLRVFISSEAELPPELCQYKIQIPPEKIHHALAFATLVISEGATVASEAGTLGTPAIYINSIVSTPNENLEQYGLIFNYKKGEYVQAKAIEILELKNLRQEYQERRYKMLGEKIDVTEFLVWFLENYPASKETIRENPGHLETFLNL